jgi:hypothetical protein
MELDWTTILEKVLTLGVGALVQWLRMRRDANLGRSMRPPAPAKLTTKTAKPSDYPPMY